MSYFSRPYAPAWGILIGGVLIGIPLSIVSGNFALSGVGSLTGLVIGMVISYGGKEKTKSPTSSPSPDIEQRMEELEKLKSKSLISDDEYEAKRKEILGQL